MKRVVIYLNYPYDDGYKKTILNQLKEYITEYEDWILKEIFVETIVDGNKQKLNEVIKMGCNKEFDILVVKNIYHLTTEVMKYLEIEKIFSENDINIYCQEHKSLVNLSKLLNKKNIDSLINYLSQDTGDTKDDRYYEMQLRLETLQKLRLIVSESIVDINDTDYLIHAYEILNEAEKEAWDYINTGEIMEV